jgi:hypothetical protein
MKYSDRIQVLSSEVYYGQNRVNGRLRFHPIEEMVFDDNFLMPDGEVVQGIWWKDDGDATTPAARKEPRNVCHQGKASFTFTGPTLILRIMANWEWGTGDIRIDGVLPSTIVGATGAQDTVCHDTTTVGHGGQYFDVLIVDNLADTTHTCEIFYNEPADPITGFCPIAGWKEREPSFTLEFAGWQLPANTEDNNIFALEFCNYSTSVFRNISVEFDALLKDLAGVALGTVTQATLAPGASFSCDFSPDLSGFASGLNAVEVSVTAEYPDPLGLIEYTDNIPLLASDLVNVTYTGSDWTRDTATGDLTDSGGTQYGVTLPRAFSETIGDKAAMTVEGDEIWVTIQHDYGWGKLDVYSDGSFITTLDCHDEDGGGFYLEHHITGLGSGTHSLELRNKEAHAAPWYRVIYTSVSKYSEVSEVLTCDFNVRAVPPFAPDNPALENGDIVFDLPIATQEDLTLPRSNTGITEVRTYCRFPTFAVYYSTGMLDILRDYDIVIVDAMGVTRQDVAFLQSMGIQVIVYTSFGEENGTLKTLFNAASGKAPWTGDGTGPGGYAGYYMKGGQAAGECNECVFDRQRLEGVKACAKSNYRYRAGVGRCGPCCGNDWRTGYKTKRAGGECGAGHTKLTYWNRDSLNGCLNSSCPDYDPLNAGCPEYEKGTNWLQDFSLTDVDYPDENGIWGSFFTDSTDSTWRDRLRDYYLRIAFEPGVEKVRVPVTLIEVTTTSGTALGFLVPEADPPLDEDEPMLLVDSLGNEFAAEADYSIDCHLGYVIIHPSLSFGGPTPAAGHTLYFSYTTRGLQADGIFMDVIGTIDVYQSDTYKQGMIDNIRYLKGLYPDKIFVANRGFSMLPDIIDCCEYVMFETFLSDYNWETGEYSLITNEADIEWNNQITEDLKELRRTAVFDVLALNYCLNSDTALKQEIYDECRSRGWLCWTSNILLNDPQANDEITSAAGPFRSNIWRQIRGKPVSD